MSLIERDIPHRKLVTVNGDEVDTGHPVPVEHVARSTSRLVTSAVNSTSAELAGGATFTGSFINVAIYTGVSVLVTADQGGSLYFDWSPDGTTADLNESFTIAASTPRSIVCPVRAQFVRIRYVNGATLQGSFRLTTYLFDSESDTWSDNRTASNPGSNVNVTNPSLSVDDGGGSFTVDGTVAVSGGSIDASIPGDDSDLDTGAGTDNHGVVAIGLPASGGHVVGGTSTNPIRIDPTGTTTQPISGTVAVSNPTANPETGLAKDATLTNGTQTTEVFQTTHDDLNANANLQVGNADVGVANPVHTAPGTGAEWNVSDRAARDLGKVDVASIDQYTPKDVDSGAGTDQALPVAVMLPASGGGVIAPGDAANGLDVDVTRLSTTQIPAALGADGGIKVNQAGQWTDATDPATSKAGRTKIMKSFSSLTVDGTAYTVTSGKKLRITQLTMSIHNTSTTLASLIHLRDGNGGTILISLANPAGVVGATTPIAITNPSYSTEPLDFSTSVYFDVMGGSPNACLNFVGYEEDL